MADNLRIEFIGSDKTEQAAKSAKQNLKSVGDEGKKAGSATSKGAAEATTAVDKVAGSASKAQEILGKLLIPAAVAGAVAGLVNQFVQMRREVLAVLENIRGIGDAAAKATRALALSFKDQESREVRVAKLQQEALEQQREATKIAQEELEKRDSIWGSISRALVSGKSRVDVERETLDTQERISKQLREQVRLVDLQIDRKRQEATDADIIAARRKLASDEERAIMDANRRTGELTKRFKEADTEAEKAKIRELWELEHEIASRTLKEIRDRDRAERIKQIEDEAAAWWAEYSKRHRAQMDAIKKENAERLRGFQELQSLQQSQRFGDSNTSVLGGRTVNVKQGGDFTRSIR